jgi:hypothetical protein
LGTNGPICMIEHATCIGRTQQSHFALGIMLIGRL